MRSSSVAEAAALAAVRYARLADEKNKQRRNVERQKELVDIAEERGRGKEGRRGSVEGRGTEGAKDMADVAEKKEKERERKKMTGRRTGWVPEEREGRNQDERAA